MKINREIKFRAWDGEFMWQVKSISFGKTDLGTINTIEGYPLNGGGKGFLISNEIMGFMQYTGLKDKNSMEIYEGDIVQWQHFQDNENGVVYWEDYMWNVANFYFASQDNPGDAFSERVSFEVIGNIHENPELLGKKNV